MKEICYHNYFQRIYFEFSFLFSLPPSLSLSLRKVAGAIPDGVIGIFYNPSGRAMALGSAQILTEMSTRNISWG